MIKASSTTNALRRLRSILGAACLAVAALAAAPLAVANAAPGALVVIDHNIEKKSGVLDRVVREAQKRRADALTLQEVCGVDADALAAKHPGWTLHFKTSKPGSCGVRGDAGTLVVWRKGSNGAKNDYALTPDPGRTPHLSCLTFGTAPVRKVCSVHLVAFKEYGGATIRPQQTQDIKRITNGWITKSNHLVIVGGDFNAPPDDPAMDHMFARGAGNNGRFVSAHELEGRAQATTDGKTTDGKTTLGPGRHIDYVFVSVNRAASGSLQIVPTGSDHHLLAATVRYN